MFNLLIAIISIALIAALALTLMFFGGDAFKTGRLDSEASRYLNESQQIVGAVRLYQADMAGGLPANLDELVPNYLRSVPEAGEMWQVGESNIFVPVTDEALCRRVNIRAGIGDEVPQCADVSDQEVYFCCVDSAASSE